MLNNSKRWKVLETGDRENEERKEKTEKRRQ